MEFGDIECAHAKDVESARGVNITMLNKASSVLAENLSYLSEGDGEEKKKRLLISLLSLLFKMTHIYYVTSCTE